MGLNTGGSTSTTTTAPGNVAGQQLQQTQIGQAFNGAGGLGSFAQPSNLYNLTPGEQLFQGSGMLQSLPGAQANRALSYVQPGSPAGNMFQDYFRNFIAPTVQNNAIASGYGGASGASMEALSRAGQTAAMQGLTSFGMPMAEQDQANTSRGLGYAGLQRQSSIQDLGRVQNLLQSLAGLLPSTVAGGTTNVANQSGSAGSMMLNSLGPLLAALGAGGQNSMLAGLAGAVPWSSLGSMFAGSPSTPTNYNSIPNYGASYNDSGYVPESYSGYGGSSPYDSYQPDYGSLAY